MAQDGIRCRPTLQAYEDKKHHYLRKLIFDGWCKLIKIPTKKNTADMTTKILPATTVLVFSKVVLGLNDILQEGTDPD
jgi:hypothetical protein